MNKNINFGQEVHDFTGAVVNKQTASGEKPMQLADIAYYVLSATKPTKDTALMRFNIGKKIKAAEAELTTVEVAELKNALDVSLEEGRLSMLEYGIMYEALNG